MFSFKEDLLIWALLLTFCFQKVCKNMTLAVNVVIICECLPLCMKYLGLEAYRESFATRFLQVNYTHKCTHIYIYESGLTYKKLWWYLKKFYFPGLSVPPLLHCTSSFAFHSICVSVYSMFLLTQRYSQVFCGKMAQPRTLSANQTPLLWNCRRQPANQRGARSDLGPAACSSWQSGASHRPVTLLVASLQRTRTSHRLDKYTNIVI